MDEMDEFSLIVQLSRRGLIHVLESIPGVKDLVVEQCLMRPLDKIASMSMLMQHGCPRVQQLRLDGNIIWDPAIPERVFICRPSVAAMRKVAELIRADPNRTYNLVMVDRKSNVCEIELEKYGVHGFVVFHELNLYAIPLESDVFSLELPPPSLKSIRDPIASMARALWQIQCLYGLIPVTYGIGEQAVQLDQHLKQLFTDLGEPSATADRPISHMVVFDRFVDVPSVLLTGLTYESMLNDCFQYSCGKITFGEAVESKLKNKTTLSKSKAFSLNNSDAIFSAVRNKHMTQVFPFLSSKAKALQSSYDKANAMSKVEEVKSFVANDLKSLRDQHKLLEVHICACEAVLEANKGWNDRFAVEQAIVKGEIESNDVMQFVEMQICRQQPPWQVLQLMCLWSVVQAGIPSRHYAAFRTMFLHAYGHDHLSTLFHLSSAGLLVETPNISMLKKKLTIPNFALVSKTLELTTKAGEKSRSGASYVFSDAYTPVIVRLLETLVSEDWKSAALRKAFPGTPLTCSNPTTPKPDNRIKMAILACFPGGVTYAEIAALRKFAQDNSFRVIVITSHIIRRTEFLQNFTDHQ